MNKQLLVMVMVLSLLNCKAQEKYLLFSSSRSGNSDIYVMHVENQTLKQITNSSSEEWAGTWINNNEVSFLRQVGDNITRHKIKISTQKETSLEQPENCTLDDKNILYASNGRQQLYQCRSDIFIFDSETQTTVNLTKDVPGNSRYPSWNFNGEQIIFTNDQSGNNDIYSIQLKTNSLTRLTNYESNDERGDLSPDQQYLVFSSDKDHPGNQDIFIKNLKTGVLTNITNSEGTELIARWSSDGERIYYGGNKDGNWELYLYHLKNKNTKRLTNNDAFDGDPRIYKFEKH
ncbi:WD40-like Beta Propeller Repeat [Zhouia amylolytica]|uniref:WD40-like Beta Propeller Repeat n=1 Tax=Zhouia amylolytica TaxID=376730 RepID=A0A1I6TAK5_9FLAO|nr:DPP IV N-terminal domain-containing protein [Zhouia amylolytica]MCQ0112631.1 PD40 domain-containing protein [Zhouia amylolytica]SFS86017.1 WD40-like Beta Propeller Repeat [Zhouia amylolytica]